MTTYSYSETVRPCGVGLIRSVLRTQVPSGMVFSCAYTGLEREFLFQAISHAYWKLTKQVHKTWLKNARLSTVLDNVLYDKVLSVISDGYLIVYTVEVPWYNSEIRGLSELAVLRLTELPSDNGFKGVVYTLEKLAALNDCGYIHVGTALATSDKALSRMYQRHGFLEEQVGLIKQL